MLYSCPNHELSREMIIQKNYARLSLDNRNLLDTSCAGSYMQKTIDFKWDLLESTVPKIFRFSDLSSD